MIPFWFFILGISAGAIAGALFVSLLTSTKISELLTENAWLRARLRQLDSCEVIRVKRDAKGHFVANRRPEVQG